MISIKNFILVYVALRSFLAIFYGVNIVAGLNILELVGFFFPVVLLLYWAMTNFRTVRNNYEKIYLFVVTLVLLTTVLKMLHYGFSGIQSFSGFFRVLNGFAVLYRCLLGARMIRVTGVRPFLSSYAFRTIGGLIPRQAFGFDDGCCLGSSTADASQIR